MKKFLKSSLVAVIGFSTAFSSMISSSSSIAVEEEIIELKVAEKWGGGKIYY